MQSGTGTTAVIDIATPAGNGGFLARLIAEQPGPAIAARAGAWLAGALGGPCRVGSTVIAARHTDVLEILRRDLDFSIAPINRARIESVNGPFVLGLDRGDTLIRERRALYLALSAVDLAPIRAAVAREAATRIGAAPGGEIDVVDDYARPIAAHTAQLLFGIAPDEQLLMDVARAIFAHTFLNIGGDKAIEARALAAAGHLRGWLGAEIARRRERSAYGDDMMGALMRGPLDDDGVRRTLAGMLVGSIDTTASAVAKIIAMIARDRRIARRIAADLDDGAKMEGWCRELLRRWPHNPILLRQAVSATRLGGTAIRPGDTIVAWTQAAMLDGAAFPRPRDMRPDRPASSYLHFGGGLHPCAGRVVNAFQIPLLVGALLRYGIPHAGRIAWAGPFPAHLPLRFVEGAS